MIVPITWKEETRLGPIFPTYRRTLSPVFAYYYAWWLVPHTWKNVGGFPYG